MGFFFGDPFGRAEIVEYQAKSNILKVEVLALPENNQPASFRGAVGRFDFSASLDKQKTKTNEPINLKFEISGTGNIKLVELPPFELPNGFEKYDPKVDEQIDRSGKISGTKKLSILIPRVAGTREISPIEFSYFDPEKDLPQTNQIKILM
ncbi:MAG: BatD family protein [Bacteroidetes bacterium]|nr:BatD family protein [Bacteroidota bacterium]